MTIVIQHLTGSKQGMTESFNTSSLSIGRDPSNDLAFDPSVDLDVSSRHAQINMVPGAGWQLIDLGSTNGTFVNGQKVSTPVPIANGSLVEFGKNGVKVQVRFQEGMAMQPPMGMMPPMQPMMQPAMAAPMGPPQKGARTKMFEAALDKSAQDAKSTKKYLCCTVVGFIFAGILGVGVMFYINHQAASNRAWHVKDVAMTARDSANEAAAKDYAASKKFYDEGETYLAEGQTHFDDWSFDEAEESWSKAEKRYSKADNVAQDEKRAAVVAEDQARLLAELEKEKAAKLDAYNDTRSKMDADIASASDADKAAIMKEREALDATFEKEKEEIAAKEEGAKALKTVAIKNQWVVCRVKSTPWIFDGQNKVVQLMPEVIGTGVFLAGTPNKLLTAKNVAKPHFYNLEAKAMCDFYREKGPNFVDRSVVTVEFYAPSGSDDGITSEWIEVLSTENSSLVPAKFGHEDPNEFQEGKTVSIDINRQPKRVESVKILKDNENNWATFDVDLDRAFPDNPEGRAKRKKIHGELDFQWRPLATSKPAPLDEVLLIVVTAEGGTPQIRLFKEAIQGQADPFTVDESWRDDYRGAPVFNSTGQIVGLAVRPGIAAIAATHIKP